MDVVDNTTEYRFELRDGEEQIGELDYIESDGVLRLVHTEVRPDHRDAGAASEFVREVFDRLRERGVKVQPDCAFVAHWLEENPDYRDMVA
jgi:predicted GNAT family acetyltransferase